MNVRDYTPQIKILVICACGLGNAILFTPALKILRKKFPSGKIDLVTRIPVAAQPVEAANLVNDIIILNNNSLINKIKVILELRRRQYDYSFTAFPSNRWLFNVFAYLINAKKRVTHSYKIARIKSLSYLQNERIMADEELHDIDQNINLLKVFNLDTSREIKQLIFYIPEKSKDYAKKFLIKNKITNKDLLIGIHPGAGSMGWKDGSKKRWPPEYFSQLCDELVKHKTAKILLFGGQEEEELKQKILSLIQYKSQTKIYLVNASLKHVAALISKCRLFVSNDSGLMHVAAAVGVTTLGIFAPTSYKRAAPFGENCYIIREKCAYFPCYKYPFYSTSNKISCPKDMECLRKITVRDVMMKINEILKIK